MTQMQYSDKLGAKMSSKLAKMVLLAAITMTGASAWAQQASASFPADPTQRVAYLNQGWTVLNRDCPPYSGQLSLRQRILEVSALEWSRFQFPVVNTRTSGRKIIVSPLGEPLIANSLNRTNPRRIREALRLGYMEDDRQVRSAIGGYWSAVPGSVGLSIQSDLSARYRSTGWAVPWSAAFVSYALCASGVGDEAQFKRNESHWVYVDQAISAATDPLSPALYRAQDLSAGLPSVGDLVCADRAELNGGQTAYKTIADRKRELGTSRDLHCDFVAKVAANKSYVAVLGGNVNQAVSLTLIPTVPARNGLPIRIATPDDAPGGGRPWFVILSLQEPTGSASLDNTAAIQSLNAN
jgi:Uncharacterized protein conserved in bacteria (DUF2272)